ncbi:MAG: hypothetical protein N2203_00995 [Bacteroidia bacterium]|nr:hypothetical protein [Bacteroidia bacterium]
MKKIIHYFLSFVVLLSCRQKGSHLKNEQDSLFVVVHTQMELLKQLPKFQKDNFFLKDTLSSQDSLLYQNLVFNYQKSLQTMDSVQFLLKSIQAECDTLNKYRAFTDTSLIQRLKYITHINQNYLQEFYKAYSIAEQNKAVLQIFSRYEKK